MERTVPKQRGKAMRIFLFSLCCASLILPFDNLPHPSTSCMPLASYECCTALTCLILLPFLWQAYFVRNGQPPVRWSNGSRARVLWLRTRDVVRWTACAVSLIAICLYHPYHRGRVDWLGVVSAPALMLWRWHNMIETYIHHRVPADEAVLPAPKLIPSLQADHWKSELSAQGSPSF